MIKITIELDDNFADFLSFTAGSVKQRGYNSTITSLTGNIVDLRDGVRRVIVNEEGKIQHIKESEPEV